MSTPPARFDNAPCSARPIAIDAVPRIATKLVTSNPTIVAAVINTRTYPMILITDNKKPATALSIFDLSNPRLASFTKIPVILIPIIINISAAITLPDLLISHLTNESSVCFAISTDCSTFAAASSTDKAVVSNIIYFTLS